MKYTVKIDYKYFTFDDRMEALDFADTAYIHADSPVKVEITVFEEAAKNE